MNGPTSALRPWMELVRLLLRLPDAVRLHWRLLRDRRVAWRPKVLLLAAVLYVVLPFDLIPDTLPLLGQIDDLTLLMLAARWFVEWCPAEVVREHATTLVTRGLAHAAW